MPKCTQYKDKKTGVKKWEWRGYVCVNPNTGKKIVTAHKGFSTKREALKDFEEFKHKILKGDMARTDLTFEELFTDFVEYKADRVKENTISGYNNSYKAVTEYGKLNPTKKIDTFKKAYCSQIFKELSKHYKRSSAKTHFHFLTVIFNYALKEGYLDNNPFKQVDTAQKYEQVEEEEANTLSKDELRTLLEYVKNKNELRFTFFHLLAFTGMRPGEARALKWSDIDFNENTISISKTITKDENGREMIGKTPKNKSSHRIVKMDNQTATIMKKHRDDMRDYYKARGKLFEFNNALIFENGKGSFIDSSNLNKILKRYCEVLGISVITLHGFRHTYISLMIEAGVQPIDITHNVGHSDLKMIMKVYDKMTQNRKEKTADTFANFMAN